MDADYDVVVVGGSFAGLVFARVAALRGLRVAVLDHRSRPGARVHTTGILVKEAADALDVPLHLTRKIRGVRLYGPRGARLALSEPGYYFLATATSGVLEWLAGEAAAAGAELRYACRFHAAERTRAFRLRLATDAGVLCSRFLVGADGAHSRVARACGLPVNRRFLVGVEAEFPLDERVPPDWLHCILDARLAPGYLAWMVPGVEVAQVGLARTFPGRPDLQALLRRLAPIADFRATRALGWRAGTIPVSGPVRLPAGSAALLIGDAGGWVSPLTGGGLANAFHFGRRAAQAVSDHLLDGGPDPAAVLARELPRYPLKRLLRRVADRVAGDAVTEAVLRSPLAAALARPLFFHPRIGAARLARRRASRGAEVGGRQAT